MMVATVLSTILLSTILSAPETMLVAIQRETPSYWGYTIAGYAFAAVVIGAFVIQTVRRGRRLSRQVPTDKRRWL